MSDLKIQNNAAAGPESLVARTADLLFADTSVRPSPGVIAELISEGFDENVLLAAGERVGEQQLVMDKTLEDLDASLPYFHMVSDRLAADFPDATLLFAGRDAEVLYDDFAIAHHDHPSHLMPASMALWTSVDFRDDDKASAFLTSYGLSGSEVTNPGNKYVLVDSGFWGSVGERLDSKLKILHGVQALKTGQLVIKLVSAETEVSDRQIMSFEKGSDFPPLLRVKSVSSMTDRARLLAIGMQIMPRYHGAYSHLEERHGRILAMSDRYATHTWDIDDVRHLNSSVVNPVAAAITQTKVVRSAMQREVNSEAELLPAEQLSPSRVQRVSSFLLTGRLV